MIKHSVSVVVLFSVLFSYSMKEDSITIITNDNQQQKVPLHLLHACKTIIHTHQHFKNNKITTPSLSMHDWQELLPILKKAYTSEKKDNKTILNNFFNSYEPLQKQSSLYSLLSAFDYLENVDLYNLCCQKLSNQKKIDNQLHIPQQIQNHIAYYLIQQTPLLSDIPVWVGKKTNLQNSITLDCYRSLWTTKYNHTGDLIAIGSAAGLVHIFNLKTKKAIQFKASNKAISTVLFDQYDNLWTTAQDGKVSCWNILNTTLDYCKEVNEKFPFCLCFHPSNNSLVFYDSENKKITIFNKDTREEALITGPGGLQALNIFSHGQHLIAGGADKQVQITDIATTNLVHAYTDKFSNGIYEARALDSNIIVAGTNEGRINLIDTREKTFSSNLIGHTGRIWSCLGYKNNFLISGSCDNTVRIWDLRTLTSLKEFIVDNYNIHSMDIFGDTFCTASESGFLKLWDLAPLFGLIEKTKYSFSNTLNIAQGELIKKLYTAKAQNRTVDCRSSHENAEALQQFSDNNQHLLQKNLPVSLGIKHVITIVEKKNSKKIRKKK